MELLVDYENITALQVEGDKGDEYQPEKLKPGLRFQRRDRARRNVSPLIIYILLGLCILLSSVALAIALIQRAQTSEIKRSDADFQMELSQWKSNVTGTCENAASSLSGLQAEISWLRASASFSHAFDQWRLFNHRLYFFSSNLETWDEALKFCAAMNSKFVVINSNKEQDYIRGNTNVDNWIGLHDTASEGTWRWVDGTDYETNVKNIAEAATTRKPLSTIRESDRNLQKPHGNLGWGARSPEVSVGVSYVGRSAGRFWADDQPNGHNDYDEDCAVVSKDGLWHDWPCSSKHTIICEKPA